MAGRRRVAMYCPEPADAQVWTVRLRFQIHGSGWVTRDHSMDLRGLVGVQSPVLPATPVWLSL
jgi:hypothetical protein